ncbi:MAG: NUDIX domain-containing protein [Bradyrhizobiaceae bacterium]|nr:MAG: NUDIX domain-containing protein [Bradyrhizobiaceae bacterium]
MSPPRRIGCAVLIDTSGNLLLQQRDDIPNILQPGKISLFGGHCEDGETCLACAVREIEEEISYAVPAEKFELLLRHEGADMEIDGDGSLECEVYVVRDLPLDKLVITEGALAVVAPNDVPRIDGKLSPLARLALARL